MLAKKKSQKGVTLPRGIHAILSLKRRTAGDKGNTIDMVLFYWPVDEKMTNIDRDNPSTLFLRLLHELNATVCIPVTMKEIDDFGTEKTVPHDTSRGIAISVKRVADAKNDVCWNNNKILKEIKNKTFLPYKDSEHNANGDDLVADQVYPLNGDDNTTMLCLNYRLGKRIEPEHRQMVRRSEAEIVEYLEKMSRTHNIEWDKKHFKTMNDLKLIGQALDPFLMKVRMFFVLFVLNMNLDVRCNDLSHDFVIL